MKTIKLFLVICVAFSLSNCSTMKLTETAPYKITGATYHTWVGGQPGVSGTNLIIGIDNDSDVSFVGVYYRNKKNTPKVETRKGKKYLVVNINTSSRRELVLKKEVQGEKTNTKSKPKPIPFSLESNEAVIKYMVGKKTFYYKVENIKKTETVYYP